MSSAVSAEQGSSKDFAALEEVHKALVNHLEQDEAQNTTLISAITDNNASGATHGYFCEPHTADGLGLPVSNDRLRPPHGCMVSR